jgi:DNA-binding winged helix-turn-helix (wHTH) protein
MEHAETPQVVCFGVYELDLRAGELRRQGVKIKLQEQPFQVLALLSERPGEVVTREELRQKLWSGGTFVDFDHSLSTAIGKIREALGDSADNPRFLETVARRGYRLIAPVRRLDSKSHPGLEPSSPNGSPNKLNNIVSGPSETNSLSPPDGSLPADSALQAKTLPRTTVAPSSPQNANGALQSVPKGIAEDVAETRRSRYGLMLAIILLPAVFALAVIAYFRHEPRNADAIRLSLLLPENVKFSDMEAPVLSPDGRLLAFAARNSSGESWLWVRPLGSMAAQVLPDTEGASQPFWSPDRLFFERQTQED